MGWGGDDVTFCSFRSRYFRKLAAKICSFESFPAISSPQKKQALDFMSCRVPTVAQWRCLMIDKTGRFLEAGFNSRRISRDVRLDI
jgi:hypothetical protein